MPWKREKGQHLRGSDPAQLPSLLPCSHLLLYLRPQLSPKLMFQKTDPHLWRMLQFMRALHCLVQEKCQVTSFEDRNWLLPPNYLDIENKNEHKNAIGITSPRPPIKEEDPHVNEQSVEKCRWGPDCPFSKNQEKEKEENKIQQQMMPLQPKVQKPQASRPKTLNLIDRYPSQTKANNNGKQRWRD